VHLFDELVTSIPDGVYLTGIKQTGNSLELSGRAQSNARVSQYMRNLDASAWLKGTDLGIVQVDENKGGAASTAPKSISEASARNTFHMTVQIENQNAPKEEPQNQAGPTAPASGASP